MDSKIIDEVFSRSATLDEACRTAAWFATPEGQEYFARRYDRETYFLNEELLEEWVDHKISSEEMKIRFISQLRMKVQTFRFRVVAAILIPFLVLTGTLTFLANRLGVFQPNEIAEIVAPYGEQLNVVLQDGTQVQLNSGSRLQYPKMFGFFNRRVKLIGEGYFAVAEDKGRSFEVDLKDIKVKVTGTHFNIKAYPDDKIIRVVLEEGSVVIADKSDNIYPIKVGECVEYDRLTSVCKITEVLDMTLHTAWRTKSLNFYRTPLKEIIKTLERQYEVKFDVSDSALLEHRFSFSTSKIDLNEVFFDLEKVSRINFKQSDEGVYHIAARN